MTTPHDHQRVDSISYVPMSELEMASLDDSDWTEEAPQPEPVDPALLARRRQLRAWVGLGMLILASLTLATVLVRGAQRQLVDPEASPPAAAAASATHVVTSVDLVPTVDRRADLPVAAVPKSSKSSSLAGKHAPTHSKEPSRESAAPVIAPRKPELMPMPY